MLGSVIHFPLVDYAACITFSPEKEETHITSSLGFAKAINENFYLKAKVLLLQIDKKKLKMNFLDRRW